MTLAELPLQLNVKRTALKKLDYKPKLRRWLSDEEILRLEPRSLVAMDVETFSNYFLVGFHHFDSDGYFYEELSPDKQLNERRLSWLLFWFRLVTFNGRSYDAPMCEAAIRGFNIEHLKEQSDAIILRGERIECKAKFDHIDLIEVAPLGGSLKLYGARVHTKRIQELPFNPHEPLTREQVMDVREYNCNDLDNTKDLYAELSPAIKLRETLSTEYQRELRSHSDAQIAETILRVELKRITGKKIQKPELPENYSFGFKAPDFLRFRTPFLRSVLERIESDKFYVDANGYAVIPSWLEGFQFQFCLNKYTMGGGGLHSNEQRLTVKENDKWSIRDYDVASYYPNIILSCGLYPAHIGPVFLEVFKGLVERRVRAKRERNMPVADGLKITTNGTFGKTSNMYSIVYSPDIGTFITIAGQLLLLMQIEAVAEHGIHPISANTDGVVYLVPKGRELELKQILDVWAEQTGFPVEETIYKSYHARDVNNFIALKEKGDASGRFLDERLGCKTKGAYCERGSALNSVLSHNPEHLICQDAVLRYLVQGVPIADTVRDCQDVRRFVTVRNVKGGGHKHGVYLGRVVRWYYAKGETGTIQYIASGNAVANTEGGKPLMELDDTLPIDINYDWYIQRAQKTLVEIGVSGAERQTTLF